MTIEEIIIYLRGLQLGATAKEIQALEEAIQLLKDKQGGE